MTLVAACSSSLGDVMRRRGVIAASRPAPANATESGLFCRNSAADDVHFSLADAATNWHIGVFPGNQVAEIWRGPACFGASCLRAAESAGGFP
jgi:hypothetical protein